MHDETKNIAKDQPQTNRNPETGKLEAGVSETDNNLSAQVDASEEEKEQ